MSMFNFDHGNKQLKVKLSNKPGKLIFGVGALVGMVTFGSTFAANINLNAGGPVEFGQGVVQATACDNDITVAPFSTFVNATGAGSHKFTSLTVSGIDSSSDKCDGKTFVIKAYGDNGILNIFSYADSANEEDNDSYNTIEIENDGGEFTWISGGTDGDDVIQGSSGDITNTSFTLSFTSEVDTITRTPLASAEDVVRITIESKDSFVPTTYAIGDRGPGGGNIFYYREAGFSCGPDFTTTGSPTGGLCYYLEAAPNTWGGGVADIEKPFAWEEPSSEDVQEIFNEGDTVNNTGDAIGLGYKNSRAIVAQHIRYNLQPDRSAAGAARAYTGGGMDDWYLPSVSELNQMCKWQRGVPYISDSTICQGGEVNSGQGAAGFISVQGGAWFSIYWASSEADRVSGMGQSFAGSYQGSWYKYDNEYVRPIRAF